MAEYLMRSGALYACGKEGEPAVAARLKGPFYTAEKTVLTPAGELWFRAEIENCVPAEHAPGRRYRLLDAVGSVAAEAEPAFAPGEDGRAVCRAPRVDRAALRVGGGQYRLVMERPQSFAAGDAQGRVLLRVTHRGVAGGWRIEAADDLVPGLVCGLFLFCRYLDMENELYTV